MPVKNSQAIAFYMIYIVLMWIIFINDTTLYAHRYFIQVDIYRC